MQERANIKGAKDLIGQALSKESSINEVLQATLLELCGTEVKDVLNLKALCLARCYKVCILGVPNVRGRRYHPPT